MDVAFLSPWEGRVEFAVGLVFEAPKKALRIVVNLDVPERVAGPGFDVVSKPATAGVPEVVAELLAAA